MYGFYRGFDFVVVVVSLLFSFKLKDSYFLDGRRVAGLDYIKPVIFVY